MAARDTQTQVAFDPETDGLAAIYREHFEFVWCVLHRFGVAPGDVDDATQDVFVIAHGRLADFEGRAAVRTWLYSIAVRVAANRRRKLARRDALLVRMPRTSTEDLEELAARGQARAILESLLARLDEHKRVVFVLAELEELTVPAIARIVGTNPRTVYSRLRAARARVASELDRLHAPERVLDDAIGAGRTRPAIAPERAPRVWAGVVASIATELAPASAVAGAGLSWLGKLGIAGGLAAAITGAVALAGPTLNAQRSTLNAQRSTLNAPPARDDTPRDAIADARTPASAIPSPTTTNAATVPTDAAANAPTPPTNARPAAGSDPTSAPVDRAAPRTPSKLVAPSDATPRTETASSRLVDEIAALDRARALVAAGRLDDALAELDRYEARFADGTLRREAAGVRIGVLCKGGRADEANEHARSQGLPRPQCDRAGA